MEHQTKKEIKELIQKLNLGLEDSQTSDLKEIAQELYEKIIILRYQESIAHDHESPKEELDSKNVISEKRAGEIVKQETEPENLNFDHQVEEADEMPVEEQKETASEAEAPLTLNDLFVPTFEGIKEDMSQKEEFKDTISLDETEKLFSTKKDEVKQLSLNDRLMGNHIQVGLNDRIAFVNKLFNFSQSDFNKVLSRLNECSTQDEAMNYFRYQVKPNYNWKGKEDLEERFVSMIERRFI